MLKLHVSLGMYSTYLFPDAVEVDGDCFEFVWIEFALAAAASAELYNDKPLLKIDVRVRRPAIKFLSLTFLSNQIKFVHVQLFVHSNLSFYFLMLCNLITILWGSEYQKHLNIKLFLKLGFQMFWYSTAPFLCYILCTRSTISIPD